MIEILKAIIIGIIQGITEVLPISSSAHNAVIHYVLFKNAISLTNEIFLHFSSLIALIIFLRKDIIEFIRNIFKKNFKEPILLITASIPSFIIYILFDDYFNLILSNLVFIGFFLIITSLILLLIYSLLDKACKENVNYNDAFIIGLSQGFALIPGISRSGMTLYGALNREIEYKKAIKFSLFLYLIASSGSVILDYNNLMNVEINLFSIISFTTTFIFTLISLYLITNKIKKKHFIYFSLYTLLLGIFTIIFNL